MGQTLQCDGSSRQGGTFCRRGSNDPDMLIGVDHIDSEFDEGIYDIHMGNGHRRKRMSENGHFLIDKPPRDFIVNPEPFSLVFMGAPGVGKTALILQLLYGDDDTFIPPGPNGEEPEKKEKERLPTMKFAKNRHPAIYRSNIIEYKE